MSVEKTLKKVMVSSTARDLPVHRKQVEEACHRMSLFAEHMMENLTAEDADAVEVSLRLVDEADVYIGIFAHRYGYVPEKDNPDQISITEMEYNRATERGIPRLVFFMHADHEVKFADVETGKGAEKLKKLKDRIGKERVAAFFTSPADLRAHCIQALSQLKDKYKKQHGDGAIQFHYVHPMTEPPEPYVAHPYTLLQAVGLIGRQRELNLLTDWITGKGHLASIRIFNVIAIGGMGKSALTWHWFNNVAPLERPNLAGRFWWSFYESDAYFENFVIRALAYVSRRSVDAVKEIVKPERERQLLEILDREEHLLVLDGIERILVAYTRLDAAYLSDNEYDKQTANWVAGALGLPESAAQSFTGEHLRRRTADPRAGQFLRKLSRVKTSRILISSRLYPWALQDITGNALPGCLAYFIRGLSDDDAISLWRHFKVSGQKEELIHLFKTFDKHPLLLQALAGEISRYRRAPRDFDAWKKGNPDFDPFSLNIKQAKSHILFHAMHGLSEAEQKLLYTVAAFRMPAQYDTLIALMVGEDKILKDEKALDYVLDELEDRGLIGWDRKANRYDLHPVVRGIVWSGVGSKDKKVVLSALEEFFESAPKIENWRGVNTFEDLTPAVELFYAQIGLGKFDSAFNTFHQKIDDATLYRLANSNQRLTLLESFFPSGLEEPPCINREDIQAFIYGSLAQCYSFNGDLKNSQSVLYKNIGIRKKIKAGSEIISLNNLSTVLRNSGLLREAFSNSNKALKICKSEDDLIETAINLRWSGLILATVGKKEKSKAQIEKSRKILYTLNNSSSFGVIHLALSIHAFYFSELHNAKSHAIQAWKAAQMTKHEIDFIQAARLQGSAALALNDHATADERLHHALTRARTINLVEEELPTLVALAELARQREQPEKARELLDDVWELAERGPYPLFHADACNVLCQIERDAGNQKAAIEAAEKAYRLAWCDGPPWAYHYGLENAKKHLTELGVEFPEMNNE